MFFIQIYLNQMTDLLKKDNDVIFSADKQEFKVGKEKIKFNIENSLKIGHDKDGRINIKDLSNIEAVDENKLILLIENNLISRITRETIMNKVSSRSHVILQITVKQVWSKRIKNKMNGETVENSHKIKGVLTVVDLAGSESVSRTGNEGLNQVEAKEINQ